MHSMFADDCRLRLHYAGTMCRPVGKPFINLLHNNPDVTELLLLCGGSGTYQFDGRVYEAKERSVLFYNQGLWHEERSHTHIPYESIYLGFSGLKLVGLPEGYFIARHLSPVVPLGEHYFAAWQRIRELLQMKLNASPESQWLSDHLLGVLLGELSDIVHHTAVRRGDNPTASRTVQTLKRYIHENYSEKINLEQLARQVHLSPYHMSRVFKKETGIAPIQYVMSYRVEVSKQYLLTSADTMESIAERVGYESETHFQHIFRRLTGSTPGQYRALHSK